MSDQIPGQHGPRPGPGGLTSLNAADEERVLFGRDSEITLLERFLVEARDGRSLVLSGEPGIGLTSLLEVAAASAGDHGYRVVAADAPGPDRYSRPLSGLRRLLRPLTPELSAVPSWDAAAFGTVLDPEGALAGSPPTNPIKIAVMLLELLRLIPGGPLLLIIDDADQSDPASFDVLRFVSDRLAGTGVAVLAAVHRRFSGSSSYPVTGHSVGSLAPQMARELLWRRHPGLSGRVTERVLANAAGNPLALLELPAALTVTERAGSCPIPFGPPLTDRLLQAWAPHVKGLPPATRRLLLLAALDDGGTLDRLSRLDADTSLAVLSVAERAGIVRVASGGALVFGHPLLRAAVVNLASRQELSTAHRSWAAVLTDELEARAWHLAHAQVRPDDELAAELECVARQARAAGDYDAATAGFIRASELSSTDELRGRREVEAAYAAARAGRSSAAMDLLTRAQIADPRVRTSFRAATVTSLLLLLSDGVSTAHRYLADMIAQHPAGDDPDDEALADALLTICLLSMLGDDADAWRRTEEALTRLRTPTSGGSALMLAVVRRARGYPEDLTVMDRAIEALRPDSDWCQVMRTAHFSMLLNRVEDCRVALRRFQPAPFAVDALGIQTMFLLAHAYLASGEWQAAEDIVTMPGLAHWFRSPAGAAVSPLGALEAYLAALRGDLDRAQRLADEAEMWAAPLGVAQVTWIVAQVRAMAASGRGDFEEAYRQLSAIAPLGTLEIAVGTPMAVILDLVEAAVRTHRKSEARAHLALLHAARVAELSHSQRLLLTAARALVAHTEADAQKLFEEALAGPGIDGRPYDVARVQVLFGEQQRRARHRHRARALLATAHDTLTGLGARPWADRAADELRPAGAALPVRATRRPGPEALNPQERRIAELGAAGLTNKEIGARLSLSPRTVGNILHRVYPKLSITSRAGLSDALAVLREVS